MCVWQEQVLLSGTLFGAVSNSVALLDASGTSAQTEPDLRISCAGALARRFFRLR